MSAYKVIIASFLNQNICFGYSKEPSQWDGSFKHRIIGFIWCVKNIIDFTLKTVFI